LLVFTSTRLQLKTSRTTIKPSTKKDKKVIEETLSRIAAALETIAQAVTTPRIVVNPTIGVEEPRQKAGPGRPRKYPRPDEGVAHAAPVAASQPEVEEVTNTGNDSGDAPSVMVSPHDVVVPEPTAAPSAVADVIPESAPAKTVGEDDIREAMISLRRVKNREGVLEILAQFGVKGVGELDPASFPDVIRAVEAAIA